MKVSILLCFLLTITRAHGQVLEEHLEVTGLTYDSVPHYNASGGVAWVDIVDRVQVYSDVYTLTCRAHWNSSNCVPIRPGDKVHADIKDTTVWITAAKGGNLGKVVRSKWKLVDIRNPNKPQL